MNELIKVTYENDNPTVSGRELHSFLQVGTEYAKWFERMCEYGFSDGIDFSPFLTESTGGRPATDHQLTISMAKEICMIQRNEKGKIARQYFLKLEDAWNTPEAVMARAIKMADARINSLQLANRELTQEIEVMKPKALKADAISASDDCIAVGSMAKILKQNGHKTGRTRFFEWLRSNGYLIKSGDEYNLPTQYSMERGLFEIEETPGFRHGKIVIDKTPKVTPKGQMYFIEKFGITNSPS